MIDIADKPILKQRRKFEEATATMAGAVAEAGLRAAVLVIQQETGALSGMAVRSAVRRESLVRRVVEQSGELVLGVLRGALPDPYAPEAFDAAVFHVAKLMATAWQAGGAR